MRVYLLSIRGTFVNPARVCVELKKFLRFFFRFREADCVIE
jgi:hypothetical protein